MVIEMVKGLDPLRDLVSLQERMNRLFEDAAQRQSSEDGEFGQEIERTDWFPAADIYEHETQFVIAMDVPGIDRSSLDITLDHDRLLVKGKREIVEANEHRNERPRGAFSRRFALPTSVDQSEIAAEYRDGVLQIRLPKRREQNNNRVEIRVS